LEKFGANKKPKADWSEEFS